MAVIQLPSIRTTITGDNVTALDSTTSFALSEKLEASRLIKSTDGSVVLDYAFISNVKSMYFYSSGTYTLTFTVGSEVIPFQITGAFRLDPTSVFRTSIVSIALSTASTTDISIDIRIYGTAA